MIHDLRTIGFRELMVFVEVVRAGSMTKAADKLHMAKSAVSTQVKSLEQILGVELLARSSRQLSLTQEGQRILPQIESLIADGDRLFEFSQQQAAQPAGIVRMAGTPDFGSMVVSQLAYPLKQRYPQLTWVTNLKYEFENLQDPFFDFAIRIGKVKDENLVVRPLGYFRRIAVASPEYLAAHAAENPITHPQDLLSHQCLLFSGTNNQGLWHFEYKENSEHKENGEYKENNKAVSVPVTGALVMHGFTTLAELASQGMGVATIPDFIVGPYIASGRLVPCLPQWHSRRADVFLAYRYGVERINRIKVVIDFMREHIPELLDKGHLA